MKSVKLFSIVFAFLVFGLVSCNNPNQENPNKKISSTLVKDSVSFQKINNKDTVSFDESASSNTISSEDESDDKPHTLN